jgi:hypothetical protein
MNKAKEALRKHILENKEQTIVDLNTMRSKSEGKDIYSYVNNLSESLNFNNNNNMKKVVTESFNVQIWCGLREAYTRRLHDLAEAHSVCAKFVNDVKECVTITPTTFYYVDGNEPGFVVGFIAYPRFLKNKEQIVDRAVDLGEILLKTFNQERLTITTPTHSIMLSKE